MEIPSLLRIEEHRALSRIPLQGSVIDLGGDGRSAYRKLFPDVTKWYTVNMDLRAHPDLVHDLETPLPVQDNTYDNALLVNVLEHVYNHRQLLEEAICTVKKGGKIVVVVPFLFPVHPSPDDFNRFTASALKSMMERAGLSDIQVNPLGTGVFAARYVMVDRLLPFSLRFLRFFTVRFLVVVLDSLTKLFARILRKQYSADYYPIGYVVHARV